MPVKVLIADDHAIIRDGLKLILASQGDMVVVGEAQDGRELLTQVELLGPDLILMDLAMPEMNGIEATRILHERFPLIKVIMLSMHHTTEHVFRAIQAGAWSYILKETAGHVVIKAIREVMRGHLYYGEGVEAPLSPTGSALTPLCKSPLESLSQREREVLQLVVEGKTSIGIAETLQLSPKSVETYRSRLMLKLGLDSIPSLVKFALLHGITPAGVAVPRLLAGCNPPE